MPPARETARVNQAVGFSVFSTQYPSGCCCPALFAQGTARCHLSCTGNNIPGSGITLQMLLHLIDDHNPTEPVASKRKSPRVQFSPVQPHHLVNDHLLSSHQFFGESGRICPHLGLACLEIARSRKAGTVLKGGQPVLTHRPNMKHPTPSHPKST